MKVSVIVPIYNVEDYILDCLNSIKNQDFDLDEFEVLCIDDGSTDLSGKIAEEFCSNIKNFHYYYKQNGGLSSARNYGLDRVLGDYICFIDSDDFVGESYLRKLYENCIKNNCDISCCKFFDYYGKIEKSFDKCQIEVKSSKDAIYTILNDDYFGNYAWNKMINKKLLNIKFPEGKYYEDLYTTYKFFLNSTLVVFTSEKLYYYRHRGGSIVSTLNWKKILDFSDGLNTRYNDLKKINICNNDFNYFKYSIFNIVQALKIAKVKLIKKDLNREFLFLRKKVKEYKKIINKKEKFQLFLILHNMYMLKIILKMRK